MKTLTRIALFLLTLLIGIQTTALVTTAVGYLLVPSEIKVADPNEGKPIFATAPDGVQISYIGRSSAADSGSNLRFLIYNGSGERLSCIGYSGRCIAPEIRIGTTEANAWVCLNGTSTYTIEPGTTAVLEVGTYDLARLPGRTELVEVGYEFEYSDGRKERYFAEPIAIPDEFRNLLRKELKERE